jgi:atypical dual specificity phosphatase
MGAGMDKILPGLYLGSKNDSEDREQLEKYQITHILSIHDDAKTGAFKVCFNLYVYMLDDS